MLNLSEILLKHGHDIHTFKELQKIITNEAVETGEIFFNLDIEPPVYGDRPSNWYEQLEITFSSAR
jgi:hypothetical protein